MKVIGALLHVAGLIMIGSCVEYVGRIMAVTPGIAQVLALGVRSIGYGLIVCFWAPLVVRQVRTGWELGAQSARRPKPTRPKPPAPRKEA
jgi:hypothetical protein